MGFGNTVPPPKREDDFLNSAMSSLYSVRTPVLAVPRSPGASRSLAVLGSRAGPSHRGPPPFPSLTSLLKAPFMVFNPTRVLSFVYFGYKTRPSDLARLVSSEWSPPGRPLLAEPPKHVGSGPGLPQGRKGPSAWPAVQEPVLQKRLPGCSVCVSVSPCPAMGKRPHALVFSVPREGPSASPSGGTGRTGI